MSHFIYSKFQRILDSGDFQTLRDDLNSNFSVENKVFNQENPDTPIHLNVNFNAFSLNVVNFHVQLVSICCMRKDCYTKPLSVYEFTCKNHPMTKEEESLIDLFKNELYSTLEKYTFFIGTPPTNTSCSLNKIYPMKNIPPSYQAPQSSFSSVYTISSPKQDAQTASLASSEALIEDLPKMTTHTYAEPQKLPPTPPKEDDGCIFEMEL